jgi:hypothetical protein
MNYLKLACDYLGENVDAVLSHRIYEDHIALVIDRGIGGGPKYSVPLSKLHAPEPKAPPEPDATDAARELASEYGIDLRAIAGSGVDGRVLVGDVREAIEED